MSMKNIYENKLLQIKVYYVKSFNYHLENYITYIYLHYNK